MTDKGEACLSGPADISAPHEAKRQPTRKRVRKERGTKGGDKRRKFRTSRQLELQEQIFERSVVYGKTIRTIAVEMDLAPSTVVQYLHEEELRRAGELASRREEEKARAVGFYSIVASKAINIAERALLPGDSARLNDAIKARQRIDRIIGLDPPTRVDVGLDALIKALDARE